MPAAPPPSPLTGGAAGPSAGGRTPTRADWEGAAAAVLRKSGRMTADDPDELVWPTLTTTTLDGVDIPPLGTEQSVQGLPPTGDPGSAPYVRGSSLTRPDEGWDVRAHLGDPEPARAGRDAVLDLENGATSLWLTVGRGGIAVADLRQVLSEVYVDLAPVALGCPEDPWGAAEAYAALTTDRGVLPAPGTSLAVDPFSAELRSGGEASSAGAPTLGRLAALARGWPGTFACTVDGTSVHDRGGTDAQELGWTLAVGVTCLRTLTADGSSVDEASRLLEFRYAATDEQLPTIAKLRAARRLWHRVLELSGAPGAVGQVQHAVTSRAMLTRYDPWVNMLRGTVAAFAAGVGGAASVTVLPFDSAIGLPDELGRRNARNTSSLLVHESHVARVTDPAGGAYAVERLTDDLARAGWAEFQRIEAEGGASASTGREDGLLDRIRDRAESRDRAVVTRRRPVTGVTEFPDLEERLPERRPLPERAPSADRYSHPFEVLRDEPATTPVFLATLGPVAAHTARATFATNLLAAGGVDTVPAGATGVTGGVDPVVSAYEDAGCPPVVCLAGTDTAYAEWGHALVTALRDAGAAYVVLAGQPSPDTVPHDLVDDWCAQDIDALAFLHRIRQELAR